MTCPQDSAHRAGAPLAPVILGHTRSDTHHGQSPRTAPRSTRPPPRTPMQLGCPAPRASSPTSTGQERTPILSLGLEQPWGPERRAVTRPQRRASTSPHVPAGPSPLPRSHIHEAAAQITKSSSAGGGRAPESPRAGGPCYSGDPGPHRSSWEGWVSTRRPRGQSVALRDGWDGSANRPIVMPT